MKRCELVLDHKKIFITDAFRKQIILKGFRKSLQKLSSDFWKKKNLVKEKYTVCEKKINKSLLIENSQEVFNIR